VGIRNVSNDMESLFHHQAVLERLAMVADSTLSTIQCKYKLYVPTQQSQPGSAK